MTGMNTFRAEQKYKLLKHYLCKSQKCNIYDNVYESKVNTKTSSQHLPNAPTQNRPPIGVNIDLLLDFRKLVSPDMNTDHSTQTWTFFNITFADSVQARQYKTFKKFVKTFTFSTTTIRTKSD